MGTWYKILKRERDARLLTQEEIAQAIGVNARTVRSWERGENVPSKHYRRKLSELYGKALRELELDEESLHTSEGEIHSQHSQSKLSNMAIGSARSFSDNVSSRMHGV